MTIAIKANPDGISGAVQVNGVDAVPFTANGVSTAGIAPLAVTPEKLSQKITLGTVVATTTGTAINFTDIPSWVKRITVQLVGVSTDSTSVPIIQLGTGGVPETSGYLGTVSGISTAVVSSAQNTGIALNYSSAATTILHGVVHIYLNGSNAFAFNGNLSLSNTAYSIVTSGSKTLAGPLNMIRLTTVAGTNNFDAGSVNIIYEG